jgi:hypothetical protein
MTDTIHTRVALARAALHRRIPVHRHSTIQLLLPIPWSQPSLLGAGLCLGYPTRQGSDDRLGVVAGNEANKRWSPGM